MPPTGASLGVVQGELGGFVNCHLWRSRRRRRWRFVLRIAWFFVLVVCGWVLGLSGVWEAWESWESWEGEMGIPIAMWSMICGHWWRVWFWYVCMYIHNFGGDILGGESFWGIGMAGLGLGGGRMDLPLRSGWRWGRETGNGKREMGRGSGS